MAQKPETLFKNRIRPSLEALPNTWVCKVQQVTIRGDPDFILCIRGLLIALELKKDAKEKADPLQSHKLKQIKKAGGKAFVVHPTNWPKIYGMLRRLACQK